MYKHVALIFALLITAAAADDYRSFKEAYAGVPWPKSMTSIEQCQKQVADTVGQFASPTLTGSTCSFMRVTDSPYRPAYRFPPLYRSSPPA
jgi:hypothetical protein